jgi:hypothetical protein
MKPISVATFLVAMLMLGTSLLWFPNIMSEFNPHELTFVDPFTGNHDVISEGTWGFLDTANQTTLNTVGVDWWNANKNMSIYPRIGRSVIPNGTPTWLIDFITFLPFLMLSIILIIYVLRLSKKGRREDFHEE